MDAAALLESLLTQPDLPHAEIQRVFESLPANASLNDFRNTLVEQNVVRYSQVMTVFIEKNLLPKSKNLLQKLETKRQSQTHFKPPKHKQKYHIEKDDKLNNRLYLLSGIVEIEIPTPKVNDLAYVQSDEKQAVMLALDLVSMGELNEVELILLETLESFKNSQAAAEVLAWLYLCTEHFEQSEICAKTAIEHGLDNQEILELLALAQQMQNKHLLAISQYQKLLQLERVKSLWYLLIAYSQERSNCLNEAVENFQIYSAIGQDPDLKRIAEKQRRAIKAK